MARKTQAQRLTDAVRTLKLWEAAGHGQEKPAMFISQMIQRMERGKYPTTGQRKWLDSLTDEGTAAFPIEHNTERLAEIDEAINTTAMSHTDVLEDFRYKLKKGWSLSEKQEAFLASLLEQARDLRENGLPVLDKDEKFLVESLLRHGSTVGRNDYFGYQQSRLRFVQEVSEFYAKHQSVTHVHLQRLRKMFKGVTRALTENKHSVGDLVPAMGRNGVVMSDAYVDDSGRLLIDVLASGQLKAVPYKEVGRRLLKNEVANSPFWDRK